MTKKDNALNELSGNSSFIAKEYVFPQKSLGFALPFPPSVNAIWRRVGRKTLLSADARRYRVLVLRWLLQQFGKVPTLGAEPLAIIIRAKRPDKRRRDLDNLPKAVLDALTHAGVWGDDSQIEQLVICWAPLERAGILVDVAAIGGNDA